MFEGVIGHRAVVALLEDELRSPAQAYLFTGPASSGKGTVARRFAAALVSRDPAARRRAAALNHPDVVAVEPEGAASITVDQARHTVAQATLAPLEGERKVFLFEEAGVLNNEAANALLKTLEEPVPSTVFLLVAESEEDLPPTVASRCRTIVFGRVAEEEVVAALRARGIPEDQAEQVARISGGRPGLALALATRPEVAEYRRVWLSVPLRLPEHPGDAYRLAAEVIGAAEPLVAGLRERQQREREEAAEDGISTTRLRDRHQRELKRATISLYVTGLEMLAGFYRDAAASQLGAAVRNPDVPVSLLTRFLPVQAVAGALRVIDAADAITAYQRPHLALAALFSDLGAGP